MTEPRIIPPDEARALQEGLTPGPWHVLTSRDVFSAVVSETRGAVGMDFENDADAKITTAAPDLAHTAAVLGDQLVAVRALHVPRVVQVLTSNECAAEECDHDDSRIDCPTEPFTVCDECHRIVEEVDPYAYERPGAIQAVAYPCPTARAAGVAR